MKKIIAFILAMVLIVSMAVPAHAVTPGFKIPDVPQISKIKFNIKIELPEDFWDDYFREHPVNWKSVANTSPVGRLSGWKG